MSGDELINPKVDQYLQQGRIFEAMQEPIKASGAEDDRLRMLLSSKASSEDAAFGALTFGDLIYDYVHIDPNVLAAAEFSHVRSINDIFSFAIWSAKFNDFNTAAGNGAVSGLQGYTAERLYAVHLQNQGHDVQLEHVSNYPGADALVDGHPFQFKCLDNVQGVRDHFATYDYPVIVNSDLAEHVVGMHNVYVDELVQRDEVRAVTESTMQRGTGLANGHIPWISLVASSPIPLYRLYRQETDITGAVTAIVTNSSARTLGGFLGGKSAAFAGSMLFGPAGAVIGLSLGSIAGAQAGRRAAGTARNLLLKAEVDAVKLAAIETASAALESIPAKHDAWNRKRQAIVEANVSSSMSSQVQSYISIRHDDDFAYLSNQARLLDLARTEASSSDPIEVWKRILSLTKRAGIHAHVIQAPLRQLEVAVSKLNAAKKRWLTA